MRKVVLAVGLGIMVLLILCGLSFGQISDGAYPLEVVVDVEGDPPKWVSCQPHAAERQAEQAAILPELFDDSELVTTAAPFDGRPLDVRVPCSYHAHAFGVKSNWFQYQSLAVYAEWPDGRRVAKVVPIPDGQTTRTLRVQLP